MTLDETRTTIEEARQRSPDAVRLAEAVCLAARVEPELLRSVRFELFDDMDAGVEADLWFGPLVQTRSPHAVVLSGEVAAELREQLVSSGRNEWLDATWRVLQRMHADAPTGIKLQEEITWKTTLGGATGPDIQAILQTVVSAIATNAERGGSLARWAAHALPELPELALSTPAASVLSVVASAYLGGQPVLPSIRLDAGDFPTVALALPRDLPRVWVGLRMVPGAIELADPSPELLALASDTPPYVSSSGVHAIAVPRTQPVVLAVVSDASSASSPLIATWRPGDVRRFEVGTDSVELRTVDGAVYRLTGDRTVQAVSTQPVERPEVESRARREVNLLCVPDEVCVQVEIFPSLGGDLTALTDAVQGWLQALVWSNIDTLEYLAGSPEVRADLEPVELRHRFARGQRLFGETRRAIAFSTRQAQAEVQTWCLVYHLADSPSLELTGGQRREAVREIVNLLNVRAVERPNMPAHLLQQLGARACTLQGAFPNWLTRAVGSLPPEPAQESGDWQIVMADGPWSAPADRVPKILLLGTAPSREQIQRAAARFPDNRLLRFVGDSVKVGGQTTDGILVDHGLFAAAVVRELVPSADVSLTAVLDGDGSGDLASLLAALADAAAASNPQERLIVYLGLTVVTNGSAEWWPSAAGLDNLSERDTSLMRGLDARSIMLDTFLPELDGVLVVAPVGDYSPSSGQRPGPAASARWRSVLRVAAAESDGQLAVYSRQPDDGAVLASGDLVGVWSGDALPDGSANASGWVRWKSTAVAAALVTGLAARWWSTDPRSNAAELRQRLLSPAPVRAQSWHTPSRRTGSVTSQTTPAADTLQPAQPAATEPAPSQFTGAQMADLYNFPREYDGSGQCIGILELGDFRRQDVEALDSQHRAFFDRYKLPMPKLTLVGLGTDSAASTLPSELEWKLGMDVQVIGAAAPGASLVMYFAPNTDDGYLSALKTAIDDRVNRPSVLYLGWGSPESSWSEQAMRLINAELQRAAEAGITVVVPAGDRGSSDGVDDKQPHVDFPASSPWVLACGATRLMFDQDGEISDEVVWNDGEELATGGGFSAVFSAPEWQEDAIDLSLASNANVRWRGVPDVAAHGAPSTYLVHIQDQEGALGGTSGAAAMWSALIARLNQALSAPVGHITPRLYEPKLRYSGVFREITQGNNGAYTAGPGWNACAGLGSVDGTRLLDALRSASSTLPA